MTPKAKTATATALTTSGQCRDQSHISDGISEPMISPCNPASAFLPPLEDFVAPANLGIVQKGLE